MDLAQDLNLALRLADLADGIAMRRFRARDLTLQTKPDGSQATDADIAVEQALREALDLQRPGDAVLGEELGDTGSGPRRWIIDPIDGTANFIQRRRGWGVLIALAIDGDPVLGVLSAPALQQRWWAASGQGAFAISKKLPSPRRLQVSSIGRLRTARLVIDDLPELEGTGAGQRLSDLRNVCAEVMTGFSPLLVAEALADAGLTTASGPWDLAAPAIILEESGGRMTNLSGWRDFSCSVAVVSNGLVHEQVLQVLGGKP